MNWIPEYFSFSTVCLTWLSGYRDHSRSRKNGQSKAKALGWVGRLTLKKLAKECLVKKIGEAWSNSYTMNVCNSVMNFTKYTTRASIVYFPWHLVCQWRRVSNFPSKLPLYIWMYRSKNYMFNVLVLRIFFSLTPIWYTMEPPKLFLNSIYTSSLLHKS